MLSLSLDIPYPIDEIHHIKSPLSTYKNQKKSQPFFPTIKNQKNMAAEQVLSGIVNVHDKTAWRANPTMPFIH